jgi:protein phosphatase PTC1
MFGNSSNNGSPSDSPAATTSEASKEGKPAKPGSNSCTQTHPAAPVPPTLDTKAATEKTPKKKTSKARELIASARNSLSASISSSSSSSSSYSPNEDKEFSRILKEDPQIQPTGSHNNSAGESRPGPKTTFRVGVSEDKNRKCRRTMEDTHAYLYNFLPEVNGTGEEPVDSDNGYFAIFDGHAGTYAAEWCGRKLHVILEETIRKHPNTPLPELLDMTFTNCDSQLEKLPVKNSGCTAVCAVMRWEDRPVPGSSSVVESGDKSSTSNVSDENAKPNTPAPSTRTERQRILYTANVGDARIVLCRGGKALRLSYDHKGSDENEGKRVANAGGLILNNRVNGQRVSFFLASPMKRQC